MTSYNYDGYDEGFCDGYNGGTNKNVGSLCPDSVYQVGYYMGTKRRLMAEMLDNGIVASEDDYELIVESGSILDLISAPLKYRLEKRTDWDLHKLTADL